MDPHFSLRRFSSAVSPRIVTTASDRDDRGFIPDRVGGRDGAAFRAGRPPRCGSITARIVIKSAMELIGTRKAKRSLSHSGNRRYTSGSKPLLRTTASEKEPVASMIRRRPEGDSSPRPARGRSCHRPQTAGAVRAAWKTPATGNLPPMAHHPPDQSSFFLHRLGPVLPGSHPQAQDVGRRVEPL
jgi:hypothetical protein